MTDERGILNLLRIRARYDSVVQESVGAFGRYQLRLLLVTQLPYLAITGSLMCTLFDSIVPKNFCISDERFESYNLSEHANTSDGILTNLSVVIDFHSLIMDLGLACSGSYFPTLVTTAVMSGGVFGAALFGFLADRYGRKCACVVALLGCCSANLLVLVSIHLHWVFATLILFMLGLFGGGYMVVNLVLLLENVGKAWRLFCTSVNGFSLGFMAMALFGYAAGRWDYYHLILGCICIPSAFGFYFAYESPRWLMQRRRTKEAEELLQEFSRINHRPALTQSLLVSKAAEGRVLPIRDQDVKILLDSEENLGRRSETRTYTYMDLVRYRPVFRRLAALTYCWFAASVVSFGLYFNMGGFAGNRFLNIFLTGLFKGTAGFLPWVISRWMGRKPILTISTCITCLCSWAAVILYFLQPSNAHSPVLTGFAIFGTAAIDPMWKINHLYSAELFPTVVRNMARAVCNIGSRLGSLLGPQIAFLASIYFPLPFIIYGTVSVLQVVVAILCLPETKGKSLPDQLSPSQGSLGNEAKIARGNARETR